MGARRRLRQVVVLCALAAGLLVVFVGPARAAQTQESLFQDDSLLVFGSPSQVARTMDTLRFLGVDRVRVTVFWNLVAPSPASRKRPSFDATNPAAYPPSAWRIYDTIVRLAAPPRPGGRFALWGAGPARAGGGTRHTNHARGLPPSPTRRQPLIR